MIDPRVEARASAPVDPALVVQLPRQAEREAAAFPRLALHGNGAAEETRELERRLHRELHLIAESDLNDSRLIRSPEHGGYGLDALFERNPATRHG